MKCMSVNPPLPQWLLVWSEPSQAKMTGPITPHFPICFNSPANPEDVIGVLLVLLTLQGFYIPSCHQATRTP